MNKVESTHGIKIAKALGYVTENQIFIIYLSRINVSFRLMRPYFLPKQKKVILDA